MKIKENKHIAIILIFILLIQLILPILTVIFELEWTVISKAEDTTNTWDISATENDHVTATLSNDGILTISGTGNMKNWSWITGENWDSNTQSIKKL